MRTTFPASNPAALYKVRWSGGLTSAEESLMLTNASFNVMLHVAVFVSYFYGLIELRKTACRRRPRTSVTPASHSSLNCHTLNCGWFLHGACKLGTEMCPLGHPRGGGGNELGLGYGDHIFLAVTKKDTFERLNIETSQKFYSGTAQGRER